ncbi:MAG: hypothetical protein LC754_03240 [Acidobacteria bacterium]|nr:hypothetical protein [Acidobacteriota bacterium]
MARITKKQRKKQLKHDAFRDTTMDFYDRLSHRTEGRGRAILYVAVALVAAAILFSVYSWWSGRRADEARLALGKAIEIADAPVVTGTPLPNETGPTFPNERERAQKAVEEFQKVQSKYGAPFNELARYFAAVNLLTVDRNKGLSELDAISKGGNAEVSARAKFALAQSKEADAQYDAAAALYQELLQGKDKVVSDNTLNLRLANVYERQDKKDEAANLLFRMIEASRKEQQDKKEGKTATESASIRAAADKLQTLSPERYAQLPPEPVAKNAPPF